MSASSSTAAKLTCLVAAFVLILFGIPPALLGAAAASVGNHAEATPCYASHHLKEEKQIKSRGRNAVHV